MPRKKIDPFDDAVDWLLNSPGSSRTLTPKGDAAMTTGPDARAERSAP